MRVLNATGNGEVVMWEIHGGDNQMWYWEGDVLKNKAYPDKVQPFIEKVSYFDKMFIFNTSIGFGFPCTTIQRRKMGKSLPWNLPWGLRPKV